MGAMDDQQQDQPDSSSELPMFTVIQPDGQSTSSNVQGIVKNDTNNNNDRNNNNGKTSGSLKIDMNDCRNVSTSKMSGDIIDDDGNNNHKRQIMNLQRYHLDNGTESVHHHAHQLLLLQQQHQQHQQMSQSMHQQHHIDKQTGNLIPAPTDNSPSLIVLQPSGQAGSAAYSSILSGFNHYATGK